MLHPTQAKLLSLAEKINIKRDGLRQIARLVGEAHPYNVSYHLGQLNKRGFIEINKKTGEIRKIKTSKKEERGDFVVIPILGGANCGDATSIAEEKLEGYLKVSKSIIKVSDNLIAIRAIGNSMNKAKIGLNNSNIEDGDIVITDCNRKDYDNNYILAIIDGCANFKKFKRNSDNTISLLSESTENHPEILIHESDDFMINGVVKQIIKKSKS